MEKELIVFTNNGQTYLFRGVTNFTNTTTGFAFDYHGVMTAQDRHAVFNNTSVAGYALRDVKSSVVDTVKAPLTKKKKKTPQDSKEGTK